MADKFYGVIATTFEREESYTVKSKGKTVTKSRTVVVPNEVTVQSSKRNESQARKELEGFARKCKGQVKEFGII